MKSKRSVYKLGFKDYLHTKTGKKIPLSRKRFNDSDWLQQNGYVEIPEPKAPEEPEIQVLNPVEEPIEAKVAPVKKTRKKRTVKKK